MVKQIASTLILLMILTSSTPIQPMAPTAEGEAATEPQQAPTEAPAQPGGVVWSEYPIINPKHIAEPRGHVYVTSFGNYTFTGDGSVLSYTSRGGETHVSGSYFWVNSTGVGVFDERRNARIILADDTTFTVEYDVVDSLGESIGRMSVTWRFGVDAKPKGTASYTPRSGVGFSVVWVIEPSLPILKAGGEVVDLSSASPRPLRVADRRVELGRDTSPGDWSSSCVCNWEDLGVDAMVEVKTGSGASRVWVTFPANLTVIDPSIVGTSPSYYSTSFPMQRKTFIANGYYWAFYSNGTSLVYGTSRNGVNWTQPTKVTNCPLGRYFSVWLNGTYICYAIAGAYDVYFRRGLITDDAITWETTRTVKNANPDSVEYPSIAVDSNGYPWVAWSQKDSNDYYRLKVAKATSKTGAAWTEYNVRYNIFQKTPTILPLTGGKCCVA